MKKLFYCLLTVIVFCSPLLTIAQYESFRHEGEFGLQVGAAHYFGDLNPRVKLNRPKIAAGIFFRKQLGDYVAFRIGANFAQVGYSDVYEKKNDFQIRRNLSFNSNIWELMLQGDFNFFKFNPSNPGERFTPYLTFGAGIFNFDPYAYLNNTKYFLRPLGTEGQGSALYPDRKPYSTTAFAFPVGLGIKFALNQKVNINFEVTHRFTTTDYLDDVSSTYAGLAAFPVGSPASFLQDRSYELGPRIGTAGSQRGFSGQRDQYILATVGVTFNITSYKCPTAN
ncbi:MAG: outer membrane beta-barrel protein [Chitinophagaceae bacterium]|nr:outer membrane beta-barrel protein [Chitinophagaceae bacterium]